jgi:hypothetical protein
MICTGPVAMVIGPVRRYISPLIEEITLTNAVVCACALARALKLSTKQQCWEIVDSYIPQDLQDEPARIRMENAIKVNFKA